MPDTASPALSDDELRETLDMIGTVLASVSDRVDGQTDALDRLVKTATEARQAAFAARSQTDPAKFGEILNQLRDREKKADRLKRLLPWFGLGAAVLALALTVTLPRFSAINGATCTVFGGQWLTASTGRYACVHYQD